MFIKLLHSRIHMNNGVFFRLDNMQIFEIGTMQKQRIKRLE